MPTSFLRFAQSIFNSHAYLIFQCCKVIMACAVLYNIRKRMGMPDDDIPLEPNIDDNDEEDLEGVDREAPMAIRQYYVDRFFTN